MFTLLKFTYKAESDADTTIVNTALEYSHETDTVVVGDDTDLLILLCVLSTNTQNKVYFRPEPKSSAKEKPYCWDIIKVQNSLVIEVCEGLLFAHAISGCDTTSRLYGIGKSIPLKKLQRNQIFRSHAKFFSCPTSDHKTINEVGQKALVCLYNGKESDSLDELRLQLFHQKVSSSSVSIHPRSLPPTCASANYHVQRVYHQVQTWLGNSLDPVEWGWKYNDGKLIPCMTDMTPAPENLLEAIHCGCKSGCQSRRCSCRKFAMNCSLACAGCKGLHCKNSGVNSYEDE